MERTLDNLTANFLAVEVIRIHRLKRGMSVRNWFGGLALCNLVKLCDRGAVPPPTQIFWAYKGGIKECAVSGLRKIEQNTKISDSF